jgi:hypothetical protein
MDNFIVYMLSALTRMFSDGIILLDGPMVGPNSRRAEARAEVDTPTFSLPPGTPPPKSPQSRHEVARENATGGRRAVAAISKGGLAHHAIKQPQGVPARALGRYQQWERGMVASTALERPRGLRVPFDESM